MKRLSILFILVGLSCAAMAQDLNARVTVVSPKLQTTSKRIFQALENAMREFLNGRKWSPDVIKPDERIACNFLLNITAWDGGSNFSGELQVQSNRPVYNSSYNTTLLNVNDRDFDFVYTEGQTIDYNDQNFQSNLSSVMAFYAYVVVGLDYDSFSRYGGTAAISSAQNVVINAQSSSYKGWKAFDNNTNSRYWLSQNLIDKTYIPLRSFIYDYHRNGLDILADNAGKGRSNITALLPVLTQLDRTRIGAMWPTVFFTAKSDELVSIYSGASPQEKLQAMNILLQADPANGNKYQLLQKN